jgi:hypothetical protein
MNLENSYPLVHITHEDVIGHLIKFGAHASTVRYEMMGIECETILLNEEFTIIKEIDLGI